MIGMRVSHRITACAVALASPAVQATATHRHYGTPTIDGIESPAEWTGAEVGIAALALPLGVGGGGVSMVTFRAMNDETYLYLALRFPHGSSPAAPAYLGLGASVSAAGLDACAGQTVGDDFGVFSQDNLALPADNHYANVCADLFPDTENEGFLDAQGTWAISLSSTWLEVKQPLDDGDDENDISVPAPNLLDAGFYAGACDASADCGTWANLLRRVFLMTADTIFFDDFESQNMDFWSSQMP